MQRALDGERPEISGLSQVTLASLPVDLLNRDMG
jgi:hypothetical protein